MRDVWKESLNEAIELLVKARDSTKGKVQRLCFLRVAQLMNAALVHKMGEDVVQLLEKAENEPEAQTPAEAEGGKWKV